MKQYKDAFAAAVQARQRFRGQGSLASWVWSIVLNTARDARRKSDKRGRIAAYVTSTDVTSDGAPLVSEQLRRSVAALPERQRLAVFLRYYADLDYRGIAEALGIEIGTVSATLSAAHRSLRIQIEEVHS